MPKIRHKFEYAQPLSCNPLMARPPSYIDIGFNSRVMCDQIFMDHTARYKMEPVNQSGNFEIMDDEEDCCIIIEDD
jgi:hypothetical protein